MVTTEFKKNAYEGYDEAQNVYALATGNAFVADGMKRETINALQNAMMNGADDDSSIATAAMKLSGHFKSSASKQNDKKDKGLSMGEMMLLQSIQNLIAQNNEKIIDLTDRIYALEDALERHSRGEFDPLNDEEDMKVLTDEGLSIDEWNAMSIQEQENWLKESLSDVRHERAELKTENDNLVAIASDPNAATVNGTPVIAELEARLEARGIDINKDNLSNTDQENMIDEIMSMQAENDRNERQLADGVGIESAADAKLNDFF